MSEVFRQAGAGSGVGSRVSGYLLEERVGQGGMGVVFRALDERLGRRVALKILAPQLAADETFRKRFIRESRAAAAVDDPHIIPVFEAGEADGVLFIAMRFVRGSDIRSLIHRDGALSWSRVAGIVAPVASALDAAHAAGMVHRDVKPANMLLDERPGRPDHVYLSDFGLSKEVLGSSGLTGSGQFLGTVDYAAPEQVEGHQVDGRADQYALGCSAFEMLCGEPPYRRDQGMAVLYAHLSAQPPSVTSRRPDLPAALDPVFARVLAKSPGDRYASCLAFSDALREAMGVGAYGHDPHARHQGPPPVAAVPRPPFAAVPATQAGPGLGSGPARPARPHDAYPSRTPGVLASRADRDATEAVLEGAFADERLTQEEFESRVGRALSVPMQSDLAGLTRDLPAAPGPPAPAHGPARRVWLIVSGAAVVVAAAVFGILQLIGPGTTQHHGPALSPAATGSAGTGSAGTGPAATGTGRAASDSSNLARCPVGTSPTARAIANALARSPVYVDPASSKVSAGQALRIRARIARVDPGRIKVAAVTAATLRRGGGARDLANSISSCPADSAGTVLVATPSTAWVVTSYAGSNAAAQAVQAALNTHSNLGAGLLDSVRRIAKVDSGN